MKIAFYLLLVTMLCGLAHGQPPAPPKVTPKSKSAPKATVAMSPKQASLQIVKTAVVVPVPPAPLFTNYVHLNLTTNPVWLEMVEYTDDGGDTWHHLPAHFSQSSNVVVTDTNAPAKRFYLLSYSTGKTNSQ